MFGKLLAKFKPITVNNAFFGQLVYRKMPNTDKSYWSGKKVFKATNRTVELIIDSNSPDKLPDADQINFYNKIENSYSQIIDSLTNMVMEEFKKFSDLPEAVSFEKLFTVSLISIPNFPNQDSEWEISFQNDYDDNHTYTVIMKGEKPFSINVDG